MNAELGGLGRWRRAACLGIAATALFARVAAAGEDCDAARQPPPLLRLSETATRKVAPTELVAGLGAVATAPTALAAERLINDLMARAKQVASGTADISATFRDYTTSYVAATDRDPAHWIASQTLEIRGKTGATVLDLVGRLQGIGLAVGELGWRVAPEAAEAARQAATLAALAALRKGAAAAAGALGLAVAGYRSIDLSAPQPFPMPAGRFMAMAARMAPPQATETAQEISATVSAEVVLGPAAPEPGSRP